MSNSKSNKFKVGDKVKVVSHNNTVKRFGRDSDDLAKIGTEGIVNNVTDWCVGIEDDMYLLDVDDVILLDKTESATKETNYSSNDSIKKTLYSPLTVQQAGDHYKKKGIQPIEYGLANNLSFPQVNVVKYITRHEDKNGLDDLAKSIHYHFFEALRVYGEEGTHELRNKVLSLLGIEQGVFK